MAEEREKSGKELMSELSHTITYLKAMGFNTENVTISQALIIKDEMLNLTTTVLNQSPSREVKDAFE